MTCDIAMAKRGTVFQLPGMGIGLPCTSPVTAVSRRVGSAMGYRMFALAEGVKAEEMGGAVDVVVEEGEEAFEERVGEVVARLAGMSGQVQAFGKWAFWTQLGVREGGGDGYEEAVRWAGEAMVCHAEGGEAAEGMEAFLGKRRAEWMT